MKIGIFGSYSYTSIGDHATLEGILRHFRRRNKALSVVIFSFHPPSTESMLISHERVKVTSSVPYLSAVLTEERRKGSHRRNEREKKAGKQRVKELLMRHPQVYALSAGLWRGFRLLRDLYLLLRYLSFWRWKVNEIRELDILIIGGGNLLMDLYSSWPIYPLLYTVMARLARVPVMFYAVGAGPIRSHRGRCYLRLASRLADAITLRDEESLDIAKQELRINKNKLSLSADPSVSLCCEQEEQRREALSSPLIGMTVVPYYSPRYWPYPNIDTYTKYISSMARGVEGIVKQFGAQVVFFATNYPKDMQAALDIVEMVNNTNQVKVIEKRLSVPEIISTIASCDVVIGTRLHSVILSLVTGTPFLAISYQPKVEAFCKRIGFERYVLSLSNQLDISESPILLLLQELIEKRATIRTRMRKELGYLQEAAEFSCEIAVRIVDILSSRQN